MQHVSSVIAIRDNGSAGGTFRYYDLDNNYSEAPGGQIASGQSFWVRATGAGASLTIREAVKVPEGATFYRSDRALIPSFAVTLSKGSVSDVAYYKIRPAANSGLDDWDGVKLDNALFDLSFVAPGNIAMAIHATNRLPCDTTIQLNVEDLTAGKYFLDLAVRHHFTRYSFSLVDKFLGTETEIDPGSPIAVDVTSNPASAAANRFSLKLRENAPSNDLRVTVQATACEDDVVGIRIYGAEAGVTYSIHTADSVFLSAGSGDSDGDLVISFLASALKPGKNILSVKAHATCHVVALLGTNAIIREATPRIWVDSVMACSGSTVILEASSDKADAQFFWFGHAESDTLGFGTSFRTEPITKSKTYFVAAVANGCGGELYEAKVSVMDYEPADIAIYADSLLGSNYSQNNLWMFNDNIIEGATGPFVPLQNPGSYTLVIDTLGCRSSATFEYFPLQSEARDGGIYAYPNPASEVLIVGTRSREQHTVEIVDGLGRVLIKGTEKVSGGNERSIEVRELSAGTYFVLITARGKKQMVRFIKED